MINDDNNLVVATYNSQGHGLGRIDYISELLNKTDLLLWQEHWFLTKELDQVVNKFGDMNVSCHGTSGMDESVILEGRPYGGCLIMWKSAINAVIRPLVCISKRICGIQVCLKGVNFLVINVYMPCSPDSKKESKEEFIDIIAEILSLCRSYDCENIIIGGDFNIDFNRNGKCKELLCDFISAEGLSLVEDSDGTNPYSFRSKANKSQSLIDHFIISDALCSKLVKYNILHDGHNMSDHSSVMIEIDFPIVNFKTTSDSTDCNQINWHKCTKENLSNYSQVLASLLNQIALPSSVILCQGLHCDTHHAEIEEFYNRIVLACVSAAYTCLPKLYFGIRYGRTVAHHMRVLYLKSDVILGQDIIIPLDKLEIMRKKLRNITWHQH